MKVLSVASECVPLVKTGGLADVVGALPRALAAQGVTLRTLLPCYPTVMAALEDTQTLITYDALFGGAARVLSGRAAGLDLFVLDAPHLYDRRGTLYLGPDGQDWPDNPERFAALSWVGAHIGAGALSDWRPDVIHAHDWQAGFTPVYLSEMYEGQARPGTLISVHNIAFQGIAPMARRTALRLPKTGATLDGYEYWGKISALKAGLIASDHIATVSPTYARELLRPAFGMGLEGVLKHRASDFTGVLNGIDTDLWNPAQDAALAAPYTTPAGKAVNKKALQEEFGLPQADGPLCIVVSRLTDQKGLDLLLEALPVLLDNGGQLALLGTGAAEVEEAWQDASKAHPNLSVCIGYNEPKAHRMMAGADAILVPSRFEPCGLTQQYGLRYGTIPLVTQTGGLADTIIPASPAALAAGVATGLQVYPLSSATLSLALGDLLRLYADKPTWAQMAANAMAQPVGWDRAAAAYAALYAKLSPITQ